MIPITILRERGQVLASLFSETGGSSISQAPNASGPQDSDFDLHLFSIHTHYQNNHTQFQDLNAIYMLTISQLLSQNAHLEYPITSSTSALGNLISIYSLYKKQHLIPTTNRTYHLPLPQCSTTQ